MVIKIASKEQFDQQLSDNKGKLVVVDFTASWCGPCKMIAPIFEDFSKVQDNANVVFLKVDVDEVPDLVEEYDVSAMPTFIFFKDGQTEKIIGANKGKLEAKIVELRT